MGEKKNKNQTKNQTQTVPATALTLDFGQLDALFIAPKQTTNVKRLWGIDLEEFWIPLLTMQRIRGIIQIDRSILGCPLVPVLDDDKNVKFDKMGRPRFKVHPEIAKLARGFRLSMTANWFTLVNRFRDANADAFIAERKACIEAGKSVKQQHENTVAVAIAMRAASETVESEAGKPEEEKVGTGS